MYIDNMNIETKYCNKCSSTKGASSFGKCSRNSDGLQSWCKECIQSKNLKDMYYPGEFMKSRSDYSVDSSRKDGMQVKCKECYAENS